MQIALRKFFFETSFIILHQLCHSSSVGANTFFGPPPGDLSKSRGAVRGAGQSRRNDFTKSSRTCSLGMSLRKMEDLPRKHGEIMEMAMGQNPGT
jgi:hypothetical protein